MSGVGEKKVDLFGLGGWRKYAYVAAVMFVGIAIGLKHGHPGLAVWPSQHLGVDSSPTAGTAGFMAEMLLVTAVVLLVAIAGRDAVVKQPEDDHD